MKPGFYNDNEGRSYPFKDNGPRGVLPDDAIVDFWSVLGPETSNDTISLISVHRLSEVISFTFTGPTRPSPQENPLLIFVTSVNDPEFTTYSAIAQHSNTTVYTNTCADPLVWEGTLTVGKLANLAAAIPNSTTLGIANADIVAARVQDLNKSYVRSLTVLNQLRTHVTAAFGCSISPSTNPIGYEDGDYIPWQTCTGGDPDGIIRFIEGYNCSIIFDPRENSIAFSAAIGAGAGTVCDDVPKYPNELPPLDSIFLSGGPACSSLIGSVNGLSAANIKISSGSGVTISTDDIILNKLIISLNQTGTTACASLGSLS